MISPEEISARFKKGEIIIFPTDTLYGIGCAISKEEQIKKLYKIRETEPSKPSLILSADLEQATKYGEIDDDINNFLNHFWPGPLTAILKATDKVPKLIQESGKVAIRVPKFNFLLELLRQVGEPLLAPSANFRNGKEPSSFGQIDRKLISLVDYALDLKDLESDYKMLGRPSTLVDLTVKPFKVIREGALGKQIKQKLALGGI